MLLVVFVDVFVGVGGLAVLGPAARWVVAVERLVAVHRFLGFKYIIVREWSEKGWACCELILERIKWILLKDKGWSKRIMKKKADRIM